MNEFTYRVAKENCAAAANGAHTNKSHTCDRHAHAPKPFTNEGDGNQYDGNEIMCICDMNK